MAFAISCILPSFRLLERFVPLEILSLLRYVRYIGFALFFLIMVSAYHGSRIMIRKEPLAFRAWVLGLLASFPIFWFWGFFRNNPISLWVNDLEAMMIFACGLFLGLDRKTEKSALECMRPSFIYSVFICSIASLSIQFGDRVANVTNPGLYRTQYLLLPALFFFLEYSTTSARRPRYIEYFGFFLFGLQQFAFQKRLPFFRFMLVLLLGMYLHWRLKRNRRGVLAILAIAVIAIMGLFSMQPEVQSGAKGLFERYQKMIKASRAGIVDFRFQQPSVLWEKMSEIHRLAGYGFGGYIKIPKMVRVAMEIEPGVFVRASIEVGYFWFILKGGVLFLFLVYSGWIYAIIRGIRYRKRIDIACLLFLIIHVAFSFGENFWGQPQQLYTFLVGLSMAKLFQTDRLNLSRTLNTVKEHEGG